MEMKDFASRVCDSVRAELGTGYRVEMKEVRKNNSVVLHGLMILAQGRNVAPTIYLEGFLEAYEAGMPYEAILRKILDAYRNNVPAEGVNMDFFRSFDKVRDRICYRLIGKRENEELLEEIPYIDFLDLAICFYYAYQDDDLGHGSILIYNSHMEMWDTCTAELFGLAKRNTPKLFPWRCCSLDEAIAEVMGESVGQADGEPLLEIPLKALSNTIRVNGAACILYPGVLEELARQEGCGLYIIPSSIHEVLLLPATYTRMSANELKQMIMDVNSTQVAPEEVLSDTLYYYDAKQEQVRQIF